MLHSIRSDSGLAVFSQSHKNILHPRALNVVVQMAQNYKIFNPDPDLGNEKSWPPRVNDVFVTGVLKLQKEYRSDPTFLRFKRNVATGMSADDPDIDEDNKPGGNKEDDRTNDA
jgi:hypothetical protein